MSAPALIDTTSGEVLELGRLDVAAWAPVDLAAFRDRLGDVKRAIDSTLADVDAAIAAELDRENTGSARFGDWHVEIKPALETVWNVPELGVVLEALVQAGKITRGAAEAALEPQPPPPPKARSAKLKKLLGHPDPDVVEAIDGCRHAVPVTRRYATVKRAASANRRLEGARGAQEGTQ